MKQIKATNTSVRDFPQVAVVSKQKIMIRSYVGKELAGRFSFDRSQWPEHPEEQVRFLQLWNHLFNADPSLFAQSELILDAQIRAINAAILRWRKNDDVQQHI